MAVLSLNGCHLHEHDCLMSHPRLLHVHCACFTGCMVTFYMCSPNEIVLNTSVQTNVPVIALFVSHLTHPAFFQACTLKTKNIQPVFSLACLTQYLFLMLLMIVGKKDGDDSTADLVDIPKRTTPAQGIYSPSNHS